MRKRDLRDLAAWSGQALREHERLLVAHVACTNYRPDYRVACMKELGAVRLELARREGRFDE